MPRTTLPKLPQLLDRKIYKTGQTRGADNDEIYQNRVLRNSTVLIPYGLWDQCQIPSNTESQYENGFIVLISPHTYFPDSNVDDRLASQGLVLGRNALVFYQTRSQWLANNPELLGWKPATQRTEPLGGQYVARVAATTAADEGVRINRGFTTKSKKGAGIRVFEYASRATIAECRLQLEALFWLCADTEAVVIANGMASDAALERKRITLNTCRRDGLLDLEQLQESRMINADGHAICPLCLLELSSQGFFQRMAQAEGRAVHDLTVTELNLFHIRELRPGKLAHVPYNLAWGHHHCNVVVRDAGILETIRWMRDVVERNGIEGLPVRILE